MRAAYVTKGQTPNRTAIGPFVKKFWHAPSKIEIVHRHNARHAKRRPADYLTIPAMANAYPVFIQFRFITNCLAKTFAGNFHSAPLSHPTL